MAAPPATLPGLPEDAPPGGRPSGRTPVSSGAAGRPPGKIRLGRAWHAAGSAARVKVAGARGPGVGRGPAGKV